MQLTVEQPDKIVGRLWEGGDGLLFVVFIAVTCYEEAPTVLAFVALCRLDFLNTKSFPSLMI